MIPPCENCIYNLGEDTADDSFRKKNNSFLPMKGEKKRKYRVKLNIFMYDVPCLRTVLATRELTTQNYGWMDGWMYGWIDGWRIPREL